MAWVYAGTSAVMPVTTVYDYDTGIGAIGVGYYNFISLTGSTG